MRYFPVFLDLRSGPFLVAGQGPLADEKAVLLERAGATVWRSEHFDTEQARHARLIVAVVEDSESAHHIKEFGDRHGILVNIVDRPDSCSFIFPAIVDRGNLIIAISTSGKSPALASKIRQELERSFGDEYSDLLEALAEIRPLVKQRYPAFRDRKNFYARLVRMGLLETLQRAGLESVRARLRETLEETLVGGGDR